MANSSNDVASLTARVERLERLVLAMVGGDEAELERALERIDGLIDKAATPISLEGSRDA